MSSNVCNIDTARDRGWDSQLAAYLPKRTGQSMKTSSSSRLSFGNFTFIPHLGPYLVNLKSLRVDLGLTYSLEIESDSILN